MGANAKSNAELCNRSEPNISDLERTLLDMNIKFEELSEYTEQFDSRALLTDPVPAFPMPVESRLNFLKPGSKEVLIRPVHVHEHLPPMYPEMETDDLGPKDGEGKEATEAKKEIQDSLADGTNGELHPQREITSVIMTNQGFISPAREGRTAEASRAISGLATANLDLLGDDSRPNSAEPRDDDESSIEEGQIKDDDTPKSSPKKGRGSPKKKGDKGSKLSVFQKQKKTPESKGKKGRPPKPKDPSLQTTPPTEKKGRGRPKGSTNKKKAIEVPKAPTSKEIISDDDDDSSPERPAKKARIEPSTPVDIKIPPAIPDVDDSKDLADNPLIPKFFGFDNSMSTPTPREKSVSPAPPEISVQKQQVPRPPGSVTPTFDHIKKDKSKSDHSKKDKEKKKAKKKKDKKEKNRDKDKKDKDRDKKEKSKEKKKKKDRERPSSPTLFSATDQKTTTTVGSSSATTSSGLPKLKIKDIGSADSTPKTKIVIKNLDSGKKSKEPPKQAAIFSDPVHIERPKSSASNDGSISLEKKAKKAKKEEKKKRERATSGGGKRSVEKRGSAIAAEQSIHDTSADEPVGGEPDTPTFSGSVVTQTVGYYVDSEGNQIWICPACGKQDDGSPMIGCDECDDWYHWMCVGIQSEPADNQDWFCPRCVAKNSSNFLSSSKSTPGKRGRPPKSKWF